MLHRMTKWAAAAAATVVLATAAWAADATGKWTWTQKFGENEITQNLELKQDGEKLTGSMTGRNNTKTEIKEGTIKAGNLSFVVVRERNGQEFKIAYKGKLDGDKITGTQSFTREGQERSREWVANRVK